MYIYVVYALILIARAATVKELKATVCESKSCQLPNCRCSSTDVPGDLDRKNVPQFITITFDGAVNLVNMQTYRRILYNRTNYNNCPIGATFYINHEYTNYQAVNELYNQGFEIALHSITHQMHRYYWREASYDILLKEFANQKSQMANLANIPSDYIMGVRVPLLQMTGNKGFQMMADRNLIYDASWITNLLVDPGLWPYTLHFKSIQDCVFPPCPNASIPGPWVMPLISWRDLGNRPCTYINDCVLVPARTDEEGWYEFMVKNFNRHYRGNRAPFGVYIHEWYLSAYPAVAKAFTRFLNVVTSLNDVFTVNAYEVLKYVKDPLPLDMYKDLQCRDSPAAICRRHSCGPLRAAHNGLTYYMEVCTACPRVYPWLDNHLGL